MSDIILHGTTILCIRRGSNVVMIGDGQVSMGNLVIKSTAMKLRRLGVNSKIVAGFAGATADALTLFERLEQKLQKHSDNLRRACVELTQDWRMDKYLRKLEAMIIVADCSHTFMLTGSGDVLEPDSSVSAIGSGGPYALSAALALIKGEEEMAKSDANVAVLPLIDIAKIAMHIAAKICVFTNDNFSIEEIAE